MSDIKEVLKERGSRYGDFPTHAVITQTIKDAMRNTRNWRLLSSDKKESLEMVAHKIGRILNGDPEYADSWVDIVGYVQLVVDQLEKGKPPTPGSVVLSDSLDTQFDSLKKFPTLDRSLI